MPQEYNNTRNPILPPGHHVPDCEAHVMPDGKLYLYGSYDTRPDVYCSGEYHVVSTPDMAHWTIHDCALRTEDIPWSGQAGIPTWPDGCAVTPFMKKTYLRGKAKELASAVLRRPGKRDGREKPPVGEEAPALLYAPDCICKGENYYLYFCMADGSEGVAVSKRPEGPFGNPRLLSCSGIDPAVFLDQDGQAYYYWGQFSANGVKLHPDMVSFEREQIAGGLVTEQGHYFHEGSSVRRIGDTYYYVYADMSRHRPTALGYATGTSPPRAVYPSGDPHRQRGL